MTGAFNIPVCEDHLNIHTKIMFLHAHGYDIEEVVKMTGSKIIAEFDKVRAQFPNDELKV